MTSDDQEDPLVEELRALFAQDDPVPPLVTETAKASLGWRRLDAELAELLSDSLDSNSPALVRGGTVLRSVSFAAPPRSLDELTIDVEIHGDGPQRIVLGQLAPVTETTVEIQTAVDAEPTEERSDRLGRFRAVVAAGGSFRLRVMMGLPERPRWIETSWISV